MLATLEDLYKFREEVDRTLQMQGLDVWRTLKVGSRNTSEQNQRKGTLSLSGHKCGPTSEAAARTGKRRE